MLNRALLVGRLTRDPELRRTGSGKAVTSFNLAVERNFKSDDQEADFINCVCWGKIAENTERYCSKGSLVSVDGRIQTRNYENNQGQKVYVTEVIADFVYYINNVKVVEDVKGRKTEVYKIKKKIFEYKFKTTIKET